MWAPEERGKAIAIYSLAPLMGPVIGPVAGAWSVLLVSSQRALIDDQECCLGLHKELRGDGWYVTRIYFMGQTEI